LLRTDHQQGSDSSGKANSVTGSFSFKSLAFGGYRFFGFARQRDVFDVGHLIPPLKKNEGRPWLLASYSPPFL